MWPAFRPPSGVGRELTIHSSWFQKEGFLVSETFCSCTRGRVRGPSFFHRHNVLLWECPRVTMTGRDHLSSGLGDAPLVTPWKQVEIHLGDHIPAPNGSVLLGHRVTDLSGITVIAPRSIKDPEGQGGGIWRQSPPSGAPGPFMVQGLLSFRCPDAITWLVWWPRHQRREEDSGLQDFCFVFLKSFSSNCDPKDQALYSSEGLLAPGCPPCARKLSPNDRT